MNKKQLFLFFLVLMGLLTASAQSLESGSLLSLQAEKKANFEIVFASIHGMEEQDFGKYEEDWYKDKPEIVAIFTSYANDKLEGTLRLGKYPDAKYTVRATVNSINMKGNYVCDMTVLTSDGTEIARVSDIKEDGGKLGSKLNLIKDGAEHTGKKFGAILKRLIKKAK